MSYSFTVRASTKAEAKEKVAAQLATVSQSQPAHAVDQAQAQAAADAFVDLVVADEAKDLMVNVNGSLGWISNGEPRAFTSASVAVSVYLAPKEVA